MRRRWRRAGSAAAGWPAPGAGRGRPRRAARGRALAAGVEELVFELRQVVAAVGGDVEGDLEPGPAVERPGIAVELVPPGGRLAQVAERHDRLAVLVDPVAQPRPLAQQRLVGELDGRHPGLGMAVEREQPGVCPSVDHRVDGHAGGQAGQLGPGGAPPGGFTLGADDDEALEHPPHRRPLVVVERGVEQLGARGDGAVDATQLPVGANVSRLSGAPLGQLVQRELQRRQRRRLVDDGVDELGDERPLDPPADALGGLDDRRLQLGRRHRRDRHRRLVDRRAERLDGERPVVEVGAQRRHDPQPAVGRPRRRASGRRGTPAGRRSLASVNSSSNWSTTSSSWPSPGSSRRSTRSMPPALGQLARRARPSR